MANKIQEQDAQVLELVEKHGFDSVIESLMRIGAKRHIEYRDNHATKEWADMYLLRVGHLASARFESSPNYAAKVASLAINDA